MKTKVAVTAIDPDGTSALLVLSTEEPWIPFDSKDIKKMEATQFRPSAVTHVEMTDEPYSYTYDSRRGTTVLRK